MPGYLPAQSSSIPGVTIGSRPGTLYTTNSVPVTTSTIPAAVPNAAAAPMATAAPIQVAVPVSGWGWAGSPYGSFPKASDIEVKAAEKLDGDIRERHKIHQHNQVFYRLWSMGFLAFSVAIFVIPIFMTLYVGTYEDAKMWLPRITWTAAILPGLYLLTYFAHLWNGSPSRLLVILNLFGSSILLLVVSTDLLLHAAELRPILATSDGCGSFGPSRLLENEWQEAATFYAGCADEFAKNHSVPFDAAAAELRIEDCPKYGETSAEHQTWKYLKHMEVNEHCTGWCTAAPSLWTKGTQVQDACSAVASEAIEDKIVWNMTQVAVYSIAATLASGVMLITLPNYLIRHGIAW